MPFFIVSGSDSTSAFFGKGKVHAFKVARSSVKFTEAFATLGDDLRIPEYTVPLLEQYVCSLYGQDKASSVNDARYTMFKLGKCTEESLPPNFDSLHHHTLRVNFESSPQACNYFNYGITLTGGLWLETGGRSFGNCMGNTATCTRVHP